jgi:hypothetical protein
MSARLGQSFPRLQPPQQAMLVALLVPQASVPFLFKEVNQLADRSDEPLVRMAYLTTQVAAADDPVLMHALHSTDAMVRQYAQWLETCARAAKPAAEPAPAPQPAPAPPLLDEAGPTTAPATEPVTPPATQP